LTYLQSDDELRERLADMRMAVKMTSDTVRHGPEPVLGKRRLKRLIKLARRHRSRPTIFTVPRLAAAAAIFIIAALVLINMQSLSKKYPALYRGRQQAEYYDERGIAVTGKLSHYETLADESKDSESKQATEVTSRRGEYAYDPVAQSPVDMVGGTIVTGQILNDGRLFVKDEIGEITGAQSRFFSGDAPQSGRPGPTGKRTSAGPFEDALRSGTRKGGAGMMGGMGGVVYGGGRGSYGVGGYGGGYSEMGGSGKTGGRGGAGGYGGMVLDGNGMAASGRPIFFHNGDAAGIQIDGSNIDNFIAEDDDGDRRPVAVFTGEPVASTKPELTLPSQPMSNASSPFDLPALKLPAEGTDSHVVWDDTKSGKQPDSSRGIRLAR